MEKMNFEAYRQPWETGRHWELKREFLENYQDVFPEEKLLCLAQTYSNIELLHCSYPTQVMIQINELSKSLKDRKKSRNTTPQETGASRKKKGKRSLDHKKTPKTKFIKFCSNKQDSPNQPIDEVMLKQSADVTKSVESGDMDFSLSAEVQESELVKKFASQIQNLLDTEGGGLRDQKPIDLIQSAALLLNSKSMVNLKVTERQNSSAIHQKYVCEFFIGTNCLAVASENDEELVKEKAASFALKVLRNFDCLPIKSISNICQDHNSEKKQKSDAITLNKKRRLDLKSVSKEEDVKFVKELINEIEISMKTNKAPTVILRKTIMRMNLMKYVAYIVTEDKNARHGQAFICEFSIKGIFIAEGKGKAKKTAKKEAGKIGLQNLMNFSRSLNSNSTSLEGINTSVVPANVTSDNQKNETGVFSLNMRLLDNSYKQDFLIFEKCVNEFSSNMSGTILNFSAQQSRKYYKYDIEKVNNITKASFLLDNKVIAVGTGSSKDDAKKECANNALKKLKNEVYTVKVKVNEEEEESRIINRCDMLKEISSSNAVPEDNIGCKMLKMMGWEGGALSKGGITEPISVKCHPFGKGLGYEDHIPNKCEFSQEINTALKNFSESGSTGVLVFSADFTKEERKEIHKIAQKYDLKSTSYGSDDSYQLCLKRKKISVSEILNTLLKSGGCTNKYQLVDMSEE